MDRPKQRHAQVAFGVQSSIRAQIVFAENLDRHLVVGAQNVTRRRADAVWGERGNSGRRQYGGGARKLCGGGVLCDFRPQKKREQGKKERHPQPPPKRSLLLGGSTPP